MIGRARKVRFLEPAETAQSLEILAEAAGWMRQLGEDAWQIDQGFAVEQAEAAAGGELVGGFARAEMTCTMRLQRSDPIYWPDAEEGEALYLHKLAVRRKAASRGWPAELVGFAIDRAREAAVPELRLDTLDCRPLINLYSGLGFFLAGAAPGPPGLVLMRMHVPPVAA